MILQKADSVDIFVADITAVVVVFCKRIHVVLYFLFYFYFLESVAPVLCGWSNNQKRLGHPGWFS